MEEWKLINDSPEGAQMKLNQWRHEYIIVVYGYAVYDCNRVSILITRVKKEELK